MALLPVSISIGILCGLWFQITMWVPWLIGWVGYCGWASFYYAGGDKDALPKSLAANLAGMIQGALFFFVWQQIGGGSLIVLSILIGIFCFVMTMEGNIAFLSAIPGQFVGAAAYFGNLANAAAPAHEGNMWLALVSTAVCIAIGNFAGLLSAKLPEMVKKPEPASE